VDDWQRFPSHPIRGSQEPRSFKTSNLGWISDLTIEGKPLATYLEETNTTAFLILHGDELLYEGYFNGSSREATQSSLSIAKSFASTLVGIAIEEGYIGSLDDSITAYIPELLDRDRRFADITIRHLLTMSSGIRFVQDESNPFSDDFITYFSPDLRAAALDSQIDGTPGIQFVYNDYNLLLIRMLLERATGMSVSEYLETRLWQPMGAEGEASWDLDSERSGFEKMSVGINARAIDFIKVGWLFLDQGWNGDRQVIPIDWVEEGTREDSKTNPAAHYQYFWWVDQARNAYYAEGNFCQFIYVYPDADLVLARFGIDCGGTYFTGLLGDIAYWIGQELEQ
jgi:CubicO group peptidase (beta-lactamase class C family)